MPTFDNKIRQIIQSSVDVKQTILQDEGFVEMIDNVVWITTEALKRGHRLFFCGNGGSASDAQHLAAEFVGRFYKDRAPLPAQALHANGSALTAIANDYGYEEVFARILDAEAKRGDILFALSTSGNSENIIKALEMARNKKVITIGLSGSTGGKMALLCDYLLNVPSTDTPRIQETHIMLGHIVCELVEQQLFSEEEESKKA